jgi:glycosyltransferase involved in cell wall biosynthesis
LRAFAKPSVSHSDIRLAIVGGGWYRPDLENEARELPGRSRIVLTGFVENAETLMPKKSDVFCLPSKYEGMPNVVMEAAMVGVPTVATRVAGTVDLIEHEVTGYLIEVGYEDRLETGSRRFNQKFGE